MRRHTIVLDSNDDIVWHAISIPRGRVVRVSFGPPVYLYGAGQVTVYFGLRQGLDVGSFISIFDTGLRQENKDIDEDSNGLFFYRCTAGQKLTPVMTLWYADEYTRYQIQV